MRTPILTAALALFVGTTVQAEGHYSDLLSTKGLAGAQETLAGVTNPTPSDQFALGGVRFLSSIEGALQTRYRYGLSGELTAFLELPLLRLPIFDNPTPDPFTPAVINGIFSDALADMDNALAALDTITSDDAVMVSLDTADIWFDINMNGARDLGEGLFEVLSGDLNRNLDATMTPPVVQFDTADAAWLSAYAHLLSGVSEVILAFDPATAVETAFASGAQMDALRARPFVDRNYLIPSEGPVYVDLIAAALTAIQGQPDTTHSRAAHAHFLGMIADNKAFWTRVAAETDNDNEWIPNKNQASALPLEFPAETGARWLAVLSDAEALLNGDLLIPHWRLGDNAGVDLGAMMQNPPPLDIVGVLQGQTVLPFAKKGQLIDARSLMAFERMVGGNAALFMIVLN